MPSPALQEPATQNLRATAIVALSVLTLISAIARSILALHHLSLPAESQLLYDLSWQALLACCVHFDRRSRLLRLPFEFDAFVFFAWPFVVPYYLHKTRGGPGWLLVLAMFALFALPYIAATIVHILGLLS